MSGAATRELIERLYAALASGDAAGLDALLAPDFDAVAAAGMPLGFGGRRSGAVAMREAWWSLGRAYSVRAHPEEWIECVDGRMLVLGLYRGRARETGSEFEARFAHLFSASDGRLQSLRHYTDTAQWWSALKPSESCEKLLDHDPE